MSFSSTRAVAVGVALLILLASVPGSSAQPPTAPARRPAVLTSSEGFRLSGAVGKPGTWTVARLRQEFAGDIKTVTYDLKGTPGQAQCIPLLSVLKASEPRLNPKVKNHLLAFTVLVRAKDGYTISFSLGELQPDVGKRAVWLALDRNGNALPEDDAPVELLVPDDGKPSRWVRGVATIAVIDNLLAPALKAAPR